MSIVKGIFVYLLFFSCCGAPAWAAPAAPFTSDAIQPDGTKIRIVNKGDESARWTETPEGYTVVKNPGSGYWEYALKEMRSVDLVPSGIVVTVDIPQTPRIRKHLKPMRFHPDTAARGSARAPASPFPFQAQQPDGKVITLVRKGDERLHWTETKDGYPVVQNPKSGYWEYAVRRLVAVLEPSGIPYIPNESPPEGWPLHLKPLRQTGY